MQQSEEAIIQHTRNWIHSFIIQLNICPFARREFERGSLRIQISPTKKVEQALQDLMKEVELLDNQPTVETTLMIFPFLAKDFFHYLDFVDLAEALLFEQNYEGIYQLATFHPDYCFADVEFDDVSNYTNRSPYPMLHILREESIEKAIAYFGDTSKIPENNIKTMHELGLAKIQNILLGCLPDEP
ncbi:hypothetical protein BN59_03332 [Legionella massiliensis]|uniref:DUF1415 domain-containing protein n=1 Tax=Legionella massiliensis TaxID=1034943 RepID=A0A078L1B0_9GAMM|nr:DUF1415 domain-containing protein [Legionella massiliensis]CDZ79017.1 hypothetical protein BN59_03332 [Legionella massiliensis]CEE14755.1 hypothetical protein BN1094_03332 [Legionella massiliensis]